MRKIYTLVCLYLFIIHSSVLPGQTKTIAYQELPDAYGNLPSGMFFGATMTASNITVNFEGPADRWFALGTGHTMADPTDVLMYSNGQVTNLHPVGWYDYYNDYSSATIVDKDPIQNWTIVSTGTTVAGQRTVTATRALNTGDVSYDVIINYASPTFSVVWARGATADYTIAYHGATNTSGFNTLVWLSQPTASFTAPTTTVCAGTPLTFSNTTTGGLTTYTWNFPSGSPAVSSATSPAVTYTIPGTYAVTLAAANVVGTSTLTQTNYITVVTPVTPAVNMGLTSGLNPICGGTAASFTALASANGGPSPAYQWQVNGISAGASGPAFNTSSLSNTAIVTCVMTSNATCPSPATATSAAVTMTVNSSAPASIGIGLSTGSNPMCINAATTFTANPGNGGTAPAYQWKINGSSAGTNSATFTPAAALSNGDIVTCVITSNAPCASSTVGTSAPVTMTVSSFLVPAVAVALSNGSNPACSGAPLTFSATPTNGGGSPFYQWMLNGSNAGFNSPLFSSAALTNSDVVTCIMTSNSPCSSPNTGTSTAVTLTINPIPSSPTITASGSGTFCPGNSIILASSSAAGNNWSTGANTPTILVNAPGTYTVTHTVNGCVSPASAPIATMLYPVTPAPSINIAGLTSFCAGGSTTLTSSAVTGNNWSTGATIQIISINTSGTYSVTQTINGCVSAPSNPVVITVYPLPVATFTPFAMCSNEGSVILHGSPPGGTFSGPSVSGNFFAPLSTGTFVVIYQYKNSQNCKDTAAASLIVADCTGFATIEQARSAVSVYPNPSQGKFTLSSPLEKIRRLTVTDLEGKQVLNRSFNGEATVLLDLTEQARGLYSIEIQLDTHVQRLQVSKTE